MLFSSMMFMWIFLPCVIALNYIVYLFPINQKDKIKIKNYILLVASLIFYAWGGITYLLIMITSIVLNYYGGILVSSKNMIKYKTFFLGMVITLNILLLLYFKYFNMIIILIENVISENSNIFVGLVEMKGTGELGFREVVLPIGISFFTFQAMSYVIDVYRNNAKPQKNILNFALYVSLFPQLIAGPIVRYQDIALQINNRTETVNKFFKGKKRFIYGLAKKVILANTFAQIVDEIWALELPNLGFSLALFGTFCYAMQIYYDFSGYSDMAIGLGKIFGFEFKENFNLPYMSLSITEFWRRWHISLSTWFKEYVYIPLGGNRKGMARTCINLFIVFLLTGIWHGANFTFIFWGITYGFIIIIEKLFFKYFSDNTKLNPIRYIYTVFVVCFLWILFRAPNIIDFTVYVEQFLNFDGKYSILSYLNMKLILCSIFSILCMGVFQKIFNKYYKTNILNDGNALILIADNLLQIILLIYSIMLLVNGTYNPFIYFQF